MTAIRQNLDENAGFGITKPYLAVHFFVELVIFPCKHSNIIFVKNVLDP